jgi:aminopeptidase
MDHLRQLRQHVARDGAFLFLTGSAPRLFQGLPAPRLAEFERIKWRCLGPLIQNLIRGVTQWTLLPAPTTDWADIVYSDLVSDQRLDALWRVVFEAFRIGPAFVSGPSAPPGVAVAASHSPVAIWRSHLADLGQRRDRYNSARYRAVRYSGHGTDLTAALPYNHRWCTAELVSKHRISFVVNLPTEEIFTAPHRNSAEGRVRVTRPVVHAGTVIEGITLEFLGGQVVAAHAEAGQDMLRQLLSTDEGARRLGEVAIVPTRNVLAIAGRCFHHPILDENAASHLALGDAYRFCSRAWFPLSINSSQVHVDLPLDAEMKLS